MALPAARFLLYNRTMINLLAQYNRRFTVSMDKTLGSMLDGTDVDILCLTGRNVLSIKVASRIEQWVEEGGRVVFDERSGRREPMGRLSMLSALFRGVQPRCRACRGDRQSGQRKKGK